MDAAAQHSIPLAQMQARASELIAEVTGAEAGCVASGAAACLFLGVAACMAGSDLAAIDRLPDTTGLRDEVIVHRAHRNPYDHAVRATGARLVEFGYLGYVSGVGAFEWQLRAAFTPSTAAVYYYPGVTEQVLDLATVVRIAHEHEVPVVVDGSGVGDLATIRGFFAMGVDLVAVSGGKSIAGPAGTGFLAGRRALILSATLQQQDMHIHPALWPTSPGAGAPEPPHQGVGRTMKVGREEVAGLLVALRRYAEPDRSADQRRWLDACERVCAALPRVDGVDARIFQGWADIPNVLVTLRDAEQARRIARALESGDPPIHLNSMRLHHAELGISPFCMRDDEVEPLARRLAEVLEAERQLG